MHGINVLTLYNVSMKTFTRIMLKIIYGIYPVLNPNDRDNWHRNKLGAGWFPNNDSMGFKIGVVLVGTFIPLFIIFMFVDLWI